MAVIQGQSFVVKATLGVTEPRREPKQIKTSPIKARWGSLVKTVRVEQELSQRQLAEISGVNRNVLRRLECGAGNTSIEVVERLFEVLGYELDAICTRKFLN